MTGESANPLPSPSPDCEPRWQDTEPGTLLIWLLVQWAALALAALRVPLAAQYTQPAELYAVGLLLAAQLASSAILAPMLCRGWHMTGSALACGCVMLLIAAAVAGWELSWAFAVMGILATWLVALWLWNGTAKVPRTRAIIGACAATYVIGSALLWYFRLEATGGIGLPASLASGPVQLVLSDPRSPPSAAWWCVGIALATGFAARALSLGRTLRRRRPTASQ